MKIKERFKIHLRSMLDDVKAAWTRGEIVIAISLYFAFLMLHLAAIAFVIFIVGAVIAAFISSVALGISVCVLLFLLVVGFIWTIKT